MKNIAKTIFIILFFTCFLINAQSKGRFYEIVKGDWLSKIALREYGNMYDWRAIQKWNKQIPDGNLIYYGEIIFIPLKEFLHNEALQEKQYQVKYGDTYRSISRKIYGLDKRWRALSRWNGQRGISEGCSITYFQAGDNSMATHGEPHESSDDYVEDDEFEEQAGTTPEEDESEEVSQDEVQGERDVAEEISEEDTRETALAGSSDMEEEKEDFLEDRAKKAEEMRLQAAQKRGGFIKSTFIWSGIALLLIIIVFLGLLYLRKRRRDEELGLSEPSSIIPLERTHEQEIKFNEIEEDNVIEDNDVTAENIIDGSETERGAAPETLDDYSPRFDVSQENDIVGEKAYADDHAGEEHGTGGGEVSMTDQLSLSPDNDIENENLVDGPEEVGTPSITIKEEALNEEGEEKENIMEELAPEFQIIETNETAAGEELKTISGVESAEDGTANEEHPGIPDINEGLVDDDEAMQSGAPTEQGVAEDFPDVSEKQEIDHGSYTSNIVGAVLSQDVADENRDTPAGQDDNLQADLDKIDSEVESINKELDALENEYEKDPDETEGETDEMEIFGKEETIQNVVESALQEEVVFQGDTHAEEIAETGTDIPVYDNNFEERKRLNETIAQSVLDGNVTGDYDRYVTSETPIYEGIEIQNSEMATGETLKDDVAENSIPEASTTDDASESEDTSPDLPPELLPVQGLREPLEDNKEEISIHEDYGFNEAQFEHVVNESDNTGASCMTLQEEAENELVDNLGEGAATTISEIAGVATGNSKIEGEMGNTSLETNFKDQIKTDQQELPARELENEENIDEIEGINFKKSDLVNNIMNTFGFSKSKAQLAVNEVFNIMTEGLREDGDLRLREIFHMSIKKNESYSGRNPKTGEIIMIPSKNAIRFKMGKELFELVNENEE